MLTPPLEGAAQTGCMNPLVVLLLTSSPALPVPQDSVLPVYGCGTSCRVETEQLSLPERMPDGWIRVKVRKRRWVNTCDWETKQCTDQPASGRAGPAEQDLWLFADCSGARFASSSKADRSAAWEQNVFYEEGEWKGTPKFQTVHGNPFMQWGKLCPAEADEGMHWIQNQFRLLLKPLREKS